MKGIAQACPFAADIFDAAIAWGVMFHLTQAEQVQVLASVSRVLKIGAPFLFTAGDADDDSGDHVGTMNGVEFHYYSFTIDGYRSVLTDDGFTLVDVHHDAGKNLYYLAAKPDDRQHDNSCVRPCDAPRRSPALPRNPS